MNLAPAQGASSLRSVATRPPCPTTRTTGSVNHCPTEKTPTQSHQPNHHQEVTPTHDHRWGLSTATSGDSNMALIGV
jgi:hypothetical protein